MHRRLLALPGAAALVLLTAGSVLAVWPPGKVAVETDGCSYTIQIDLDIEPDIIGWDVRVFAEDWMTGEVINSGTGVPDDKGRLTAGPFTAPPGHYNLAVDDEVPDKSSNVVDFTLSCAAATPTPTPTPTATPTATPTGGELPATPAPTPTPNGGEQPVQGTPPPTGEVLGLTPPPTDAAPTADRGSGAPTTALLLALVAVLAGGGMLMRRPSIAPTRPRSGRDGR